MIKGCPAVGGFGFNNIVSTLSKSDVPHCLNGPSRSNWTFSFTRLAAVHVAMSTNVSGSSKGVSEVNGIAVIRGRIKNNSFMMRMQMRSDKRE